MKLSKSFFAKRHADRERVRLRAPVGVVTDDWLESGLSGSRSERPGRREHPFWR